MEWANGKVRQCRGKGNRDYDDNVASFINYVERELCKVKEDFEENVA